MTGKLAPALVLGLFAAAVVLAATMALALASTRQLATAAAQLQHRGDVRLALQAVLSLAADAESGQLGFLVTGKPEYLEPYRYAVRTLGGQLDALAALVQSEPGQQAGLGELRRRAGARLGELELAVANRQRAGFAAAQEAMLLGTGKAEMDALRKVVAQMSAGEDRALDAAEAEAGASYRRALAGGLAAWLGLAACVWQGRRLVHARRAAEAALAAEGEKFRTTLASIGDAVIATDPDARITHMNAVAEALTGWSHGEAQGRPLADVFRVVDEVSRQPVESPLARALREGSVAGRVDPLLLIGKDGGERAIDNSAAPIRTAEGSVAGAVLVFRDISGRKRIEKALIEAETRLRRVVMEMPVPTMAFAEDGSVVFVNDAWVEASGYGREQLGTIADWADRAYPERGGFMRQHIASLFGLRERVNSGERQVTHAGGGQRVWHFFTAPIGRDANGRRLLVTNAIDVTERKRMEHELQAGEARLRFALEAAGLGLWELDVASGAASRTPRHDQIYGYDTLLPEWTFERFLEHVLPEERAQVVDSYRRAVAGGARWDFDCRIRRRDGAVRRIRSRASMKGFAPDRAGRWIGILADITEEPGSPVA